MKNIKVALTFGLVIAMLVIAYFGSVYLANKSKNKPVQNKEELHGSYSVENKDFGYKFNISDEFFAGYQEEQNGYSIVYDIPYERSETGYTSVFAIIATPKDMAAKFTKLCEQNRQTAPIQCTDYTKSDGQNNLFYFNIQGSQGTELTAETDPVLQEKSTKILESIMSSVKSTIKFSDVASVPKLLKYTDFNAGYDYQYPTEFDLSLDESVVLALPPSLDKEGIVSAGSPGLKHVLPIKYCALSGKCENTTTNFIVSVLELNYTENQLLNSPLGQKLNKFIVGGQLTYFYNEGAEGEGINYHFIISPNDGQMLVVIHKYIDETVIASYANAKNFVTYVKQQKLVNNLIESINFWQPWRKK